jgi:hypothetical protein
MPQDKVPDQRSRARGGIGERAALAADRLNAALAPKKRLN